TCWPGRRSEPSSDTRSTTSSSDCRSGILYWTATMTNKALCVAAGMAALAGGLLFRGSASTQAEPAAPSVTLLLTLGLKADKAETWDGTARVSGGTIAATEGRHFSAGDAVSGPGAWKCVTRRDEVAPYADIHYTEMRPGDKPAALFQPVGVFLTIHP